MAIFHCFLYVHQAGYHVKNPFGPLQLAHALLRSLRVPVQVEIQLAISPVAGTTKLLAVAVSPEHCCFSKDGSNPL